MEESVDTGLVWIFVLGLLILIVPPSAWLITRRIQHKARRRMVDSPRKIAVVGPETPACPHVRSRRGIRLGPEGVYMSNCRRCGTAMKRNGPGDWETV
jgi:hypothetical protein